MRKIMFVPEDYGERFGDIEWHIPEGWAYDPKLCYTDDGSPVAFKLGKPYVFKIGKRRFARITFTEDRCDTEMK